MVIAGSAGLHARRSFRRCGNKFEAEIFVRANGKLANGKAMASLQAQCRRWLEAANSGPVPMPMQRSPLKAAVESGLGDEEEVETVVDEVVWTPVSNRH